MKFKALSLSLLILLPLVMFAAPLTKAFTGPVMWVNPLDIRKWAPCTVSSTFDVEVKLWNKKDLTGVGVYAFDFNLTWLNSTLGMECGSLDRSLITLVGVSARAPWDHYFVVVNGTIKPFLNAGKYYTGYHLAVTALDNSTPLTDSQIVLATLTFHIDCEPLWPDVYTTPFDLEALLSDLPDPDTGVVGPIAGVEVHDGTFTLESYQPDVHMEPRYFCEYKVDMGHTVEFWLSNMSKVYGFGFGVTFNNTLLKANVQSIKFCDAFPAPYEFLLENVEDNGDGTSTLIVELTRPCEKPTVTHQAGPAVTFSLISTFDDWADNTIIPNKDNSTIVLSWAYVLAKCGCGGTGETRQYDYGNAFPGHYLLLAYNATIDYFWRPRTGDLNLDGAVDIQDLQALAAIYGTDTGPALNTWGNLDGSGKNTKVDIFDFVVVAKYFGKPYTCDIADP